MPQYHDGVAAVQALARDSQYIEDETVETKAGTTVGINHMSGQGGRRPGGSGMTCHAGQISRGIVTPPGMPAMSVSALT